MICPDLHHFSCALCGREKKMLEKKITVPQGLFDLVKPGMNADDLMAAWERCLSKTREEKRRERERRMEAFSRHFWPIAFWTGLNTIIYMVFMVGLSYASQNSPVVIIWFMPKLILFQILVNFVFYAGDKANIG